MVALQADKLLAGPRGRGLCLAVAQQLRQDLRAAVSDDAGSRRRIVRELEAVDPAPVNTWRDPLDFVEAMDICVTQAMYWQRPEPSDVMAAHPDVVNALRPLAAAIVAAPASAWWSTSVDIAALRYTSRYDDARAAEGPVLTGARDRLAAWRAHTVQEDHRAAVERPRSVTASVSGSWWSTPAMASLVTTTRPLPGLGSVQLAWEEDNLGESSAEVWSMIATRDIRAWEIDGPQSWVRLVDRYPLEVTSARRHDWYRTTGRDGPWQIPDWEAVALDWDAVHLSVAGYLSTATRPLLLSHGNAATLLAGWDPDQAWWLTDTLTTTPEPVTWVAVDDPAGSKPTWRRQSV